MLVASGRDSCSPLTRRRSCLVTNHATLAHINAVANMVPTMTPPNCDPVTDPGPLGNASVVQVGATTPVAVDLKGVVAKNDPDTEVASDGNAETRSIGRQLI